MEANREKYGLMECMRTVLLFLIWLTFPQKHEIVKGKRIPYMKLPVFLVGFCGGRMLYHKKSERIMVFVSGKDSFLRYTVYHEYREGEIFKEMLKGGKNPEQISNSILDRLYLFFEVYNISLRYFPSREIIMLVKNALCHKPHFAAILDEIELAKEELLPDELESFYKAVRKEQRFGLAI